MWVLGAYAGGTHTCALIRNNILLAHSTGYTCTCNYGFELYTVLPLMARYIRLQEEGRAVHKIRRQIHVTSAHASERFWNGKRSHCPVGMFWTILERQVLSFRSRMVWKGTFTLCLATITERWEWSRHCSVNGV